MNKKGDYWSVTLLITTGMLLVWASWLVLTTSSPIERATGISSVLLYNVYDEAEADLLYCDKSLEYGFSDSLKLLLEKGGTFDLVSQKGDYLLWKRDVQECYPTEEKIKENLGLYLNNEINEKLDKINLSSEFKFTFEKEGNKLKVVGEPTDGFIYSKDLENIKVNYKVNPTLTLLVDYDLDQVMLNVLTVKAVIDSCGEDAICWQNNANFDWSNNGKIFTFDVDLGKIEDVFGETDLVLKAAVDFGSSIGKSALVC